ncbi:hypothetical protein HF295_02515 [Hujiaoplasma nucleasis]|uniref:InlB B-repeat-containing protein n=1 Tax=Hujiaoplasma nucleasis TaxID=2725268 RepID=A0A7L6N476_9MOLU|nr:hypothetical protein [Hujiaoplasma nucleasis]QLY39795.1 hypothetical protein HF295_02515 [Hujiaoplasma nucleasis]
MRLHKFLFIFLMIFILGSCSDEPTTLEVTDQLTQISTEEPTTDLTTDLASVNVNLHYSEDHVEVYETKIGDTIFLPVLTHEEQYHYVFAGWSNGEDLFLGYEIVTEDMTNLEPVFNLIRDVFSLQSPGIEGAYIGESTTLVIPAFYGAWNNFQEGDILKDRNDIEKLFIPDTITFLPDLSKQTNLKQVIFYEVDLVNQIIGFVPNRDNPAIHEVNGLKIPLGYMPKHIVKDTLSNQWIPCKQVSRYCIDTSIVFSQKEAGKEAYFYANVETENEAYNRFEFSHVWQPDSVNLSIQIDEASFTEDTALKVYFLEGLSANNDQIKSILVFDSSDESSYDSYEQGLYQVDLANHPDLMYGVSNYQMYFTIESESMGSVGINYISLQAKLDDAYYGNMIYEDEIYLLYAKDYDLFSFTASYEEVDQVYVYSGSKEMVGGQALAASFTLNGYQVAYRNEIYRVLTQVEFKNYTEDCTYMDGSPIDYDNPQAGELNDGCMVMDIVEYYSVTVPGQGVYYSYGVHILEHLYKGYEEMTVETFDQFDDLDYLLLPIYLREEE